MRLELGWAHVWIHNLSANGMLIWASQPPRAGSYIELRKAASTIISRVIWVRDKFFGVRTEERLDLRSMLSRAPQVTPSPVPGTQGFAKRLSPHSTASSAQVSTTRAIEFAALVLAVSVGAVTTAMLIYAFLTSLFRIIGPHLLSGG
jgi:hypothetical protein